jgi:hypothetical protein
VLANGPVNAPVPGAADPQPAAPGAAGTGKAAGRDGPGPMLITAPADAGRKADDWLYYALARILLDVKLFARTFVAFLIRPGRSAREWQACEREFMNPLAFAAGAASVYWAATSLVGSIWPIPEAGAPDTLARQFGSALSPYVHYGLLSISMHLALGGLGSRRPVLGSVGAALFTGGSIGTLAALVLNTAAHWVGHERGTTALHVSAGDPVPIALFFVAGLFYLLLGMAMLRALMVVHQTPAWKTAIAGAFAILVTALLFGSVLPAGEYGWHPYLRVETADGFALSFGFRG